MDYTLKSGKHNNPDDGLCAMEWVAYLGGEEHSDSPVCVDPPLRKFAIGLNDRLPNDLRQELRPYLARMIGTAGDGRTKERGFMLADWAVRVTAAEALGAAGRTKEAATLRDLPEITDRKSADNAKDVARLIASAPSYAAYAASAFAAASADANAAAAAYAAAYAADAAAYAYADAAASAAYAASASAPSRPVWERLLPSALDLLDRMLPTEAVEIPAPVCEDYEALIAA